MNAPRSAIVDGDNAREIALHYLEPVSVRVCVCQCRNTPGRKLYTIAKHMNYTEFLIDSFKSCTEGCNYDLVNWPQVSELDLERNSYLRIMKIYLFNERCTLYSVTAISHAKLVFLAVPIH